MCDVPCQSMVYAFIMRITTRSQRVFFLLTFLLVRSCGRREKLSSPFLVSSFLLLLLSFCIIIVHHYTNGVFLFIFFRRTLSLLRWRDGEKQKYGRNAFNRWWCNLPLMNRPLMHMKGRASAHQLWWNGKWQWPLTEWATTENRKKQSHLTLCEQCNEPENE